MSERTSKDTPADCEASAGDDGRAPTRRQFLGAAAALSALATGTATAAGTEVASEDDDASTYASTTVVNTRGGMTVEPPTGETEVVVSTFREGIGLKLANRGVQVSALLLPEDIEPLCEELLAARGETNPDDVAAARAWRAEPAPGGDGDA